MTKMHAAIKTVKMSEGDRKRAKITNCNTNTLSVVEQFYTQKHTKHTYSSGESMDNDKLPSNIFIFHFFRS